MLYLLLVAKEWSATLAGLAPPPMTPVNVTEDKPTVGEFLAGVERTSKLKPKTFHRYPQYFRIIGSPEDQKSGQEAAKHVLPVCVNMVGPVGFEPTTKRL